MIAGVSPFNFPDLYSRMLIGTMWTPGTLTLAGHDRTEDWDIQAAKGQTGATSQLNGRPVGQFEATFYLAADSNDDDGENDFSRWEACQRLIESTTAGKSPIALPVYHPDLVRNHFTSVVSGGVGGLVWDSRGGATVKVKFLEYRPPAPKPAAKAKAKAGKPGANAAGAKPVAKPDPNAAAKKELAGLLAAARKP